MDRKPLLWIVAVVVALIAGWQIASAQGEKGKAAQKWEYRTIVTNLQDEKRINEMAADGWELAFVDRTNERFDPALCFKRAK